MTTLYKAKRFFLDVIYPNKCPFCDEVIAYDAYYCSSCIEGTEIALPPEKLEPLRNVTATLSLFEYNKKTSPFVYAIKEGGDGYAVSAAAKLLCESLAYLPDEIGIITCIPTDAPRMRNRGYNPPKLIAAEMSAISGLAFAPKLLMKSRRTEIQKSLSAAERRENLKDAFHVTDSSVSGNILLIDDVRTTGATLDSAAGVLISAGATKVYAGVIATVI
ncbi:MAG: double zinc ribbon domain-containing protein [Oscillospiraceae bacterium]|nr:double zinc ribbon domain-containing protein [Oscillospiraceae bacterium]